MKTLKGLSTSVNQLSGQVDQIFSCLTVSSLATPAASPSVIFQMHLLCPHLNNTFFDGALVEQAGIPTETLPTYKYVNALDGKLLA